MDLSVDLDQKSVLFSVLVFQNIVTSDVDVFLKLCHQQQGAGQCSYARLSNYRTGAPDPTMALPLS